MGTRTACAAVALSLSLALTATAVAAPARTKLNGNRPPWAASAQRVGDVPSNQQIDIQVYLPWRNSSELGSLVAAVSNPRKAQYHQYLTPDQFRARFAPAQSEVDSVSAWLKSQGLQVTGGPLNRHWIDARGTAAELAQAFGTTLGNYNYKGSTYRAPDAEPSAPSSIAGDISAVLGLQDADAASPSAAPPAAFVNAPPCSTYWAEKTADTPPVNGAPAPYAPCGYDAAQLNGAYGTGALGLDGSGQTVGIVDAYAAPTIQQDFDTYSSRHGLPSSTTLTQIWSVPNLDNKSGSLNSHCAGPSGWYGEETLDVEAVHNMAPGANIIYSGGNNCLDPALDEALTSLLDDGRAQIISNSYGSLGEFLPAKEIAAEHAIFEQAAVQGIGLYFSSGDDGDESDNLPIVSPDFPASDPLVTAVGGTSLAVGASDNYLFETGWGTGKSTLTDGAWDPPFPGAFLYGSGGGTSRLFAEPDYQKGVVPTSLSGSGTSAARVVPDVAADGDPNTGMLVGETQTFPKHNTAYGEYRLGGTSLASPLFAGIMALADQAAGFHHGFANPALYAAAGGGAFRDVTPSGGNLAVVRNDFNNSVDDSAGVTTTLRSLDHDSSLATAVGYDNVTGLGSPDGGSFMAALSTPPTTTAAPKPKGSKRAP